jgi:hypothetical protein
MPVRVLSVITNASSGGYQAVPPNQPDMTNKAGLTLTALNHSD